MGYWQGVRVWLVGVQWDVAYSDEGSLFGERVLPYGMGVLPRGTLLVGDTLYGYCAQLLEQLEGAGWLLVMRVEDGLRQRVRWGSRLRAWQRAQRYAEVLGGRYRIEQVFGRVKGVYRSDVGSVWWSGARRWVWGMWVLWNLVGVARLGGAVRFWLVLCRGIGIFQQSQVDGLLSTSRLRIGKEYKMCELVREISISHTKRLTTQHPSLAHFPPPQVYCLSGGEAGWIPSN